MTAEDETRTGTPIVDLENAAFALAAAIAVQREAADTPLEATLDRDDARTAVLVAAGLVDVSTGRPVATADLHTGPTARSAGAARLAALRQILDIAEGRPAVSWADQPDAVLLDQGRASAFTGRALATRLVPILGDLAERLDRPGARVLDIGTGVGALAAELARNLPNTEVLGIDVLPRAVELARREIARDVELAGRVTVREEDAAEISDTDTYELVWFPAPFLPDEILPDVTSRAIAALRRGGWLVVGTNPAPRSRLADAVARWNAARHHGSAARADDVEALLIAHGLLDVRQIPTVPDGPVLVAGRRS